MRGEVAAAGEKQVLGESRKMKGIVIKETENTGTFLDEEIESVRSSCKRVNSAHLQNQGSGIILGFLTR